MTLWQMTEEARNHSVEKSRCFCILQASTPLATKLFGLHNKLLLVMDSNRFLSFFR